MKSGGGGGRECEKGTALSRTLGGTFALDVNSETVGGMGGRYYSARGWVWRTGMEAIGGGWRGMHEFPCANREEA